MALFYHHETLAKSVRGFIILYLAFFVGTIVLNCVSEAAWTQPGLGRLLFYCSLIYVAAMLLLTVWFLRLLYQTHECINRPLSTS